MAKKKGIGMALNLSQRQKWLAGISIAVLLLVLIPWGISSLSGNDAPKGTSATASPTLATNINVQWAQKAEGSFTDQEKEEIAQKLKEEIAQTFTEDSPVDKYVILSGSQEGEWGDVNVSVYPSYLNGESIDEPLYVLMKKSGGTWSLWTQSNDHFCDEIKQTPEGFIPGKESYFGHCYK